MIEPAYEDQLQRRAPASSRLPLSRVRQLHARGYLQDWARGFPALSSACHLGTYRHRHVPSLRIPAADPVDLLVVVVENGNGHDIVGQPSQARLGVPRMVQEDEVVLALAKPCAHSPRVLQGVEWSGAAVAGNVVGGDTHFRERGQTTRLGSSVVMSSTS